MVTGSAALLVGTVGAIGILHTLVPDHWAPITVIARQRGWTVRQTIRAAALAGLGHVLSTLALGAIVWLAGMAIAAKFGHWVAVASSIALIAFGLWIALQGWREHAEERSHHHAHEHGTAHHHHHDHKGGQRTALLLILGSSPMIEGLPAFFAASTFGTGTILVMSLVFAASTMVTYVILCAASVAGLSRVNLGPLERYAEVLSGLIVAAVGVVFWIWPLN